MNIEDQLREYKATLDASSEAAGDSPLPRGVVPIRVRPVRALAIAAVAVAATIAIAFAAVGVAHHSSSTSPAGVTTTPTTPTTVSSPITVVATVTVPNVVGMRTDSAAVILSGLHLSYEVVNAACSGPSDVVNRQLPAAGTGVRPDQVVSLVLCNAGGSTTLTVVSCPTEVGTAPSPSDPVAPKSLTIATPSFTSPALSGYSDGRGLLPTIGPAGWNCKAIDATDGGVGVGVTPPGATPRDSWGVGSTVTQPSSDGVFAGADPACQGCVYGEICNIVPSAGTDFPDFANTEPCATPPAGQHVTPLGNNLYRIDDPAGTLGPDAARSILRYTPKTATTDAGVIRETCILPASQGAVCDALLNQFLALHPARS